MTINESLQTREKSTFTRNASSERKGVAKTNSIKATARIAGLLYLSLIPLGVFGILYVPSIIIVPGDMAATVNNIMANESLFRLSILSAIAVQIINIFVVLLLYKILKPANKNHAVLMVIFILLGIPIAFLNELNHFAVLQVLSGAEYLAVFTADQLHALVPLFLDFHLAGINIAQVFWGLWLIPMGVLVFKSGYLPRFIGVLLVIGGFGYLVDSVIFFIFPSFGVTFSEFTFLGEFVIALWLLIKGVNVEQWEKRALEAA